jgi:hypothetical protein
MTGIMGFVVMTGASLTRTQRAPAVVLLEEHNALGLRPVHVRDRILARVRTMSLDEQLAAGTSPESHVLLALHATRLCQPDQRRRLADSLRAVALAAQQSRRTRVPIDREGVRLVLGELEAVATRLDTNEPIDVSGIARVRRLLANGGGPLYRQSRAGLLQRELLSALDALDTPA